MVSFRVDGHIHYGSLYTVQQHIIYPVLYSLLLMAHWPDIKYVPQ